MTTLPTRSVLAETTLLAFNGDTNIELTTKEINDRVANILQIPEELQLLEDDNMPCSKYGYMMRWARTELKQRHKIENVSRGKWKLV